MRFSSFLLDSCILNRHLPCLNRVSFHPFLRIARFTLVYTHTHTKKTLGTRKHTHPHTNFLFEFVFSFSLLFAFLWIFTCTQWIQSHIASTASKLVVNPEFIASHTEPMINCIISAHAFSTHMILNYIMIHLIQQGHTNLFSPRFYLVWRVCKKRTLFLSALFFSRILFLLRKFLYVCGFFFSLFLSFSLITFD